MSRAAAVSMVVALVLSAATPAQTGVIGVVECSGAAVTDPEVVAGLGPSPGGLAPGVPGIVVERFGPAAGALFSVDPSGEVMDLSVGDNLRLELLLSVNPGSTDPAAARVGSVVANLFADGVVLCSPSVEIPDHAAYAVEFLVEGVDLGRATLHATVGLEGWTLSPAGAEASAGFTQTDSIPVSVGQPYVFAMAGKRIIDHGQEPEAHISAFVLGRAGGTTTSSMMLDGQPVPRTTIGPPNGAVNRYGGTLGLPIAPSAVVAYVSKPAHEGCAYSPPHPRQHIVFFEPNRYSVFVNLDSVPEMGGGYIQDGDLPMYWVTDYGIEPPECADGEVYSADECGCITKEIGYRGLLLGVSERIAFLDPEGVDRNLREGAVDQPRERSRADLRLTKTAFPDITVDGGTVTYRVTVFNAGPDPGNFSVRDTGSGEGIRFVDVRSADGDCQSTPSTFQCNFAEIDPGREVAIEASAIISAERGEVRNTARIALPGESDPSIDDTWDVAVVRITAEETDLSISKSDSNDPVDAGEEFFYTITVRNESARRATGVRVTDVLPNELVYVAGTSDGGDCSISGATVVCTLGPIDSGASREVTLAVAAREVVTEQVTIINRAQVTSDVADANPLNNETSETTRITGERAQLCALLIAPGAYASETAPGCGIGDSTWSCASPAEVNIASATTSLGCDGAGNCGAANTIFGAPNHTCTVHNLGGGRTQVRCSESRNGTVVNQCVEDFRLIPGGR